MAKSKGVGRGGRRPGAGRPRKGLGRELREAPAVVADDGAQEAARAHTALAIQTLVEICLNGEREAARVAAANALLDRGHGKPGGSVLGTDGKKARRQATAERSASAGRFAVPSPPKLVVSNQ